MSDQVVRFPSRQSALSGRACRIAAGGLGGCASGKSQLPAASQHQRDSVESDPPWPADRSAGPGWECACAPAPGPGCQFQGGLVRAMAESVRQPGGNFAAGLLPKRGLASRCVGTGWFGQAAVSGRCSCRKRPALRQTMRKVIVEGARPAACRAAASHPAVAASS